MAGIHIVVQMGLTALSLIFSVLVLRLVLVDNKNVPGGLKKVCESCHSQAKVLLRLCSFYRD